jgi:hypothetical protein
MIDPKDPWLKMAEECRKIGPRPANPALGFVANLIIQDPEIVSRTHDEGFDARVAGKTLDENPYHLDGTYGFWRTGWFAADSELDQGDEA